MTHDSLERIRTKFDIDLAAVVVAGGNPVQTLATPVDRLFQALWVILEEQLRCREIGPRQYFPELFATPPGPVARRIGRTVGVAVPHVYQDAARALCRGLANLYPGTVFARSLALDERRGGGDWQ